MYVQTASIIFTYTCDKFYYFFQEDEYSHSTPKLHLVTLHMFLHLASTFCNICPVEILQAL